MPELPEVETVRAGLEPLLRGRRFKHVEQRRKDLRFALPDRFVERLTGAKVLSVDRRAKYLVLPLDSGEVLAMHLGMTGRFTVSAPGGANGRVLGNYTYEHGGDATHDHVVFTMSGGAVVTYNDARRFGYMALIAADELNQNAFFAGLGVEPLSDDLDGDYLAAKARGRKLDLKAFLMDQRIVAGLGNIYVCEALFRARLDPFKGAARLATKTGKPTPHAAGLAAEIKTVLRDAIRAGGSTLRDYKQADGSSGSFQKEFSVYGREGEPCSRKGCRGIVRRKTQGGRSTFWCPVCQR
ncbi:MAG: bifunctional DNA-formamidopyrimidine glycosylase/DNA-(apurinic or apyrimidinic site) lyase [Hyphomicrobiaceae bacterium]